MGTAVSVIIPVYNEEEDIGKCLASLNKQSYRNFEIVIVDDDSTDKTLEVVKKFSRIRIFKQNHQGPGNARNLGAKKAEGDILVFVDADMTFEKNYLKNLVSPILENIEITGTTHDSEIVKNNPNYISALWGRIRVSKKNVKEVPVFRAIRKKVFLKLGGFDAKYGYADDQTFWLRDKIMPTIAENTLCYHKNPETLRGTYKQARWIGTSWRERFFVFRLPFVKYVVVLILFILLPFVIAFKSIQTKRRSSFEFRKIINFFSCKFAGYLAGLFRAVYFKEFWR
ncbi:MAG: glycosyltransferase family 2 protein [Nanoarchaeota archaeon]|nr:glycosyltransferase family 2 protein [Nanoarchaeota archaeon]MBU4086120.1 glycosyltransferase family 2 protein [Nanoarchaeota archaeon]